MRKQKKRPKSQPPTPLCCSGIVLKKIPSCESNVCFNVWVKTGLFYCNEDEDLESNPHLLAGFSEY